MSARWSAIGTLDERVQAHDRVERAGSGIPHRHITHKELGLGHQFPSACDLDFGEVETSH
jgi:hypothetical protein